MNPGTTVWPFRSTMRVCGPARAHLLVSTHSHEPPIRYGDRSRDAELAIDRHHVAIDEDEIDRCGRYGLGRLHGGRDGAAQGDENGC